MFYIVYERFIFLSKSHFFYFFSPVCLLFSEPSPNGEHRVDYSVCCIEIARSLARTSSDLVLQEIDVQSVMDAICACLDSAVSQLRAVCV